MFKPFHQIFVFWFFSSETLSFFVLTRWAEKLQMRAHICRLERNFYEVEKAERKDVKLLEKVFSYFAQKKLRMSYCRCSDVLLDLFFLRKNDRILDLPSVTSSS